MSTHPVFEILGIPPGSGLDQVERAFMDHVKTHIQAASDNYDDDQVQKEERYLRQVYPLFFDYSVLWIKDQLVKNAREKSPPEALRLKKEARNVLTSLQNDILSFAICYMHISRFMTLVRDEIKSKNMKAVGFGHKPIKWTSETGMMLGQNKKRKMEIDALNAQYAEALTLFAGIEKIQGDFEQGVATLFSRADAEKLLRGFRASIRISDFDRAGRALAEITALPSKSTPERRAALLASGREILEFFKKNARRLVGDERKLFLNAGEIKVMQDAHDSESRKIRAIMLKYNLPYMEYKLEGLARLLDRLMVIGSTEGLMTLYRKLITGMAAPLRSMEEIRGYESEVLGLIKHLQASQFQDIPKIYAAAAQTVEEFRQVRNEYEADMDQHLREQGAADAALPERSQAAGA